jgi:3-phenylpropionate/trans-cinnamate dioxygenase ferredoxin reductase component
MSPGMVIVGAGECGIRAAIALREAGSSGPLTLIGSESRLPYERPPLSKEVIAAATAPEPKTIATREQLAAVTIGVIAGNTAVRIDRQEKMVKLADGTSVPYQKLLLATGAAPRRLPQAPRSALYLRTFDDALAVRSRLLTGCRVAIIGGGFIGLELAASARAWQAKVVLIEPRPRLLMRGVPEEIAASVEARHRAEGVDILCGQGIADMEESCSSVRLRTSHGRQIEADLCVIGIGAIPVTELAQAARLAIDNGIAVNEFLQTSDPDIFAAGDCCSVPLGIYDGRRIRIESWRNAQEQAALAALNMLGHNRRYAALPWFWSDQYEVTLYVAGLPEEGCVTMRRELADGAFLLVHLAGDGRLVAASGIGPGNAAAKDIRLAEMLIAKRTKPTPRELMAADIKLKALLAA